MRKVCKRRGCLEEDKELATCDTILGRVLKHCTFGSLDPNAYISAIQVFVLASRTRLFFSVEKLGTWDANYISLRIKEAAETTLSNDPSSTNQL